MDDKNAREINLIDVFNAIGRFIAKFFQWLISFLIQLIRLLYRNKILILVCVLLGVIVSQYIARPSNRKYYVGAMAELHGVEAKTIMPIGDQLLFSSNRIETTSLQKKLSIPDSVARDLEEVKLFYVIDYKKDSIPDRVDYNNNHSLSDTVNVRMNDYVYIRLKLHGTQHAEQIGNSVLNYFNSNAVAKADYDAYVNRYKNQIHVTDIETLRIDSLAKKKYFEDEKPNIKFSDNKLLLGNQQTQLFYGELLYLQRNKAVAETKLARATAPLVLPSGFIINPQPLNGRLKMGLFGILIGIVVGTLIACVIENYEKWLKFMKNEKSDDTIE